MLAHARTKSLSWLSVSRGLTLILTSTVSTGKRVRCQTSAGVYTIEPAV